jgi:group I intron endonuclease
MKDLTPLDYNRVKPKPGIYVIRNVERGLFYLGSTVCLERRIGEHFSRLRSGAHKNERMVRHFREDGEQAFKFEAVYVCEADRLTEVEQYYLDSYRPWRRDVGYNRTDVAYGTGSGARHPLAKFTREQVVEIRRRRAESGESHRELAQVYGCSKSVISKILTGRRYQDAGGPIEPLANPSDSSIDSPNAAFTRRSLREAREMYMRGASFSDVAKEFGTTKGTARRAVVGGGVYDVGAPVIARPKPTCCDVNVKRKHATSGANHFKAKLTADDVRKARRMRLNGFSFGLIAREFPCNKRAIRRAIQGETWAHVEDPKPVSPGSVEAIKTSTAWAEGEGHGRASLSSDDVCEMRRRKRQGATYSQLASEFGVARCTVKKAVRGITYSNVTAVSPLSKKEAISSVSG